MTTAQTTTIDHGALVMIGEQWLKRRGIFQTLTETAAKTAIDGKPLCQIPDVYGYGVEDDDVNGRIIRVIATYEIDAKTSKSDAKANKGKPHQNRDGWGVGKFRYIICEPHIIETYEAEDMGRGLLYVTPDGEVHDQFDRDRTHYTHHHRNSEAEAYLNWVAWRSHELDERMETAQAKRKAMSSSGPRFPADLADGVRDYLNECGPATFSAIFGGVPGLRTKFKKLHAAQKAMDAMLDTGKSKGFGQVPMTCPQKYDVESRL